jgi:hypothetical protein
MDPEKKAEFLTVIQNIVSELEDRESKPMLYKDEAVKAALEELRKALTPSETMDGFQGGRRRRGSKRSGSRRRRGSKSRKQKGGRDYVKHGP